MNWTQQQEGEERQGVHKEGELEEEVQLAEEELGEEVQPEEEELGEEELEGGEEEEPTDVMQYFHLDFSCGEDIYIIWNTFLGSGLNSCTL